MNVSYRAKVVEGKSLIDIVDDCLDGDDLSSLVELDNFSRQNVTDAGIEPDEVARMKLTGQHHLNLPILLLLLGLTNQCRLQPQSHLVAGKKC